MTRTQIRDRNILFVCRDNGCLSFLAESMAQRLLPPKTQVFSGGLKQDKIDPKALQVLREIGIDISSQQVKGKDIAPKHDIDLIVVLGNPGEVLPTVAPSARHTTWNISDPCREPGADLNAFRHARDEISARIGALFLDHWRNLA